MTESLGLFQLYVESSGLCFGDYRACRMLMTLNGVDANNIQIETLVRATVSKPRPTIFSS